MPTLTADWQDYELIDSGQGRKLERFGPVTLIRPEVQAGWQPAWPAAWQAADAEFVASGETGGHWLARHAVPERWQMHYGSLRFWVQANQSRQVGVFPENAPHWDWIAQQVQAAPAQPRVLNLFGYTGLASLAAAAAGAHVTHVDAAKKVVTWGRANQALSGLADRPIRWLVEDVLTYLRREQRRGMRYDGIVLDPPAFGRGPDGQVWTFERLFDALYTACRAVFSPTPRFLVATIYTRSMTADALRAATTALTAGLGGRVEIGELVTHERSADRLLHHALYARWQATS